MLNSASDYEYITTTGIESALTGQIIPVADVASLQAPIRFEDFCYICEATRVWNYNDSEIRNQLNPQYVRTSKYALLEYPWNWIYDVLKTGVAQKNRSYGCTVYLNSGIESTPTFTRTSNWVGDLKTVFGPMNLLFDPTAFMDACQWTDASGHLDLPYHPYDVLVPRLLYWILFQDVYQEVYSVSETSTTSYDKSYSFTQYSIKSGPATWHTSSGGVISTVTGAVEHKSPATSYPEVAPIININPRTTQEPLGLRWYSYYGTQSGQYESGYEYCYDGVDGDAYSYIDFRRDDIVSAYALVEYVATNNSTYLQSHQYKLEKLTQENGRRWYFKSIDKAFAKSLMESIGADFTKVGTRSPSSSSIPRFYCSATCFSIFAKFNHKYSETIKGQWQWTPVQQP